MITDDVRAGRETVRRIVDGVVDSGETDGTLPADRYGVGRRRGQDHPSGGTPERRDRSEMQFFRTSLFFISLFFVFFLHYYFRFQIPLGTEAVPTTGAPSVAQNVPATDYRVRNDYTLYFTLNLNTDKNDVPNPFLVYRRSEKRLI